MIHHICTSSVPRANLAEMSCSLTLTRLSVASPIWLRIHPCLKTCLSGKRQWWTTSYCIGIEWSAVWSPIYDFSSLNNSFIYWLKAPVFERHLWPSVTKWKNRKNGRIEIVSPDEGIPRLTEASEWGSSHTHKTLLEPRVLQTLVFWTFTEDLCYAFLSSAIGLFCFQASIPLWIIRLYSQSDGNNTSSCAILFEIPPAGMMLRHVPYKYLDSLSKHVRNRYEGEWIGCANPPIRQRNC